MEHFLEISDLSFQQIEQLLGRALYFKRQKHYPDFSHHNLANLFYENSTRTRVSFEMAAKLLNMNVVNVDIQHSSENKGEIPKDTLDNLAAMGIKYFVIRHKDKNFQRALASTEREIHIINAGDGSHAHPSQALLDMMTIMEKKQDLACLKIVILGNIRHSRVANSFQCLCKHLDVAELVLTAPKIWLPETVYYGRVSTDIGESLQDADVVMCLRVQSERMKKEESVDLDSYIRDYKLTKDRLALAKPDAMVLHPGPINRGVEIDTEVADGPQSYILDQVTNGVFARMAIIEALGRG